MSILLTPEQVAFRNAALVRNLRFKFPQLGNYPDEALVKAFDEWFMQDDTGDEEGFLEFLEPPAES